MYKYVCVNNEISAYVYRCVRECIYMYMYKIYLMKCVLMCIGV